MSRVAAAGVAAALVVTGACGNDVNHDPDAPLDAYVDKTPFDQCEGDPASFVRQAFLALDGRRPRSQAEVDVYVDLWAAAVAQGGDPKDTVARAIMARPEFAERWVDVVMDGLHVQRVDIQSEASCWDQGTRSTVTPALAATIRDKTALQGGDGTAFTMLDLARSAIALDDLSPVYRAEPFSMVQYPIPAANVPPIAAELARREDFGVTFDSAYLHRDVVCLACHNSEMSVTDNDDPALDRFWPVPGSPEKAIYGMPTGIDSARAHAVFRVDSFVSAGFTKPWGWSTACGSFAQPATVPTDLAGIDGKLGNITGMTSTVFDLEASLQRGFAALEAAAPTGDLSDPDAALAWLVTLKMTEDVWKQATGGQLTIANYFPRNQASSDLLNSLAGTFATSHYSLKALLSAILASSYFNRRPPEAQCGPSPYTYPNVFDPWVIADADPTRRLNGPGDAVTPIDARTLVSATTSALDWSASPTATRFPEYNDSGFDTCTDLTCSQLQGECNSGHCCATYNGACQLAGELAEPDFERAVGMFLRNSERGFRGLDFQARLAWEDRFGLCGRPRDQTMDFIDALRAAGAADPAATAADVVGALKDRLVGEPAIADGAEHDALVAILGGPLEAPATGVLVDRLRLVCGAIVASPQFLLQGIAGRGGPRPRLTPAAADYDAVCGGLAQTGIGVPGKIVTCGAGTLTLAAGAQRAPTVPHVVVHDVVKRRVHGLDRRRKPAGRM